MRISIGLPGLLGIILSCPPLKAGEFDYFEISAGYAEIDGEGGAYVDAYSTSMGLGGSVAMLDNLAFDYGLQLERSDINDFENKSTALLFGPNFHFALGESFDLMLRYTAIRDEIDIKGPNGADLGSDSDVGESVGIGLRGRLGYTDYVDFDLFEREVFGVTVEGYSLQVVIGNETSALVIGFSSAEDTEAGLTSDGVGIGLRTTFH